VHADDSPISRALAEFLGGKITFAQLNRVLELAAEHD
jgi:hypothetical protein